MLSLKNIYKTFEPGTPSEKKVFDNLSLDVADGDFITIIGSNGAGKSTLFNLIAGSFLTDKGSIILDGKNITMTPEHERARVIGRLFQDPLKGTAPGMEDWMKPYILPGKTGETQINERYLYSSGC